MLTHGTGHRIWRRAAAASAAGVVAASLLVTGAASPVSAEPAGSLADVERRVDALALQVEKAAEDYHEAREALTSATRRAAAVQGQLARAERDLADVRRGIAAVVAGAYRSGGGDELMSLVATSDPQSFLDRAASLDRIARSQADQLLAIRVARARLESTRAAAAQQRAAVAAVERRMAGQKRTIERALATQRDLLDGLQAQERRRYEAMVAERRARAAAAARASRDRPTYTGPASGRAAVAVQEAYNKLGSPYKWGATGPDRFDCSGLTTWVWAKAGVSLPRTSRSQYAAGRKVSRSDLQPGDLVYYGDPIHHVGIYIGGGRMISAPQTGDVVKVQNAFRRDYTGATRP